MLHGYKKSRYNIYDNLEFLGLDPYEQKYFCFGEGGDNGAGGADDYEETTGFKGFDDPDPEEGLTDPDVDEGQPQSIEAQQELDELTGRSTGLDEAEATNLDALVEQLDTAGRLSDLETGFQGISMQDKTDALEAAYADPNSPIGYNDLVEAGYFDMENQLDQQAELAAAIALEQQYGLKRGQVTPAFMTDPTGVQTASFRGPGAVGAVVNEVARGAANLGLNLVQMAPTVGNIGMQIARDQGLFGLDKKSLAEQAQDKVNQAFDQRAETMRTDNLAARGITEPETLAEQVAAAPEGYNPAIGMADPTLSGLPGVSYEGAPFSGPRGSFEEMSERAAAKGFNEYQANLAALAAAREGDAPANIYDDFEEEQSVGGMFYDAPTVEDEFDYDYLGADDGTVTKTKKQVKTTPVVEEVDVAQATPVAFPNIDTTPPSRISRIARIYNISEDAAKRMLGVA